MKNFLFLAIALFILQGCKTNNSKNSTPEKTTEATEATNYDELTFKNVPEVVTSYVKNTLKFSTDKLHSATIDLNNDGKNEYIFYILDMEFCGSGGCTFFILNNNGTRLSRITVANAPMYVSNETSNGYRNLITFSDRNWQQLTFDGKKYTSNASMGKIVDKPTTENATLLFNLE